MIALKFSRVGGFLAGVSLWVSMGRAQGEALLAFKRDTFAFANETVFEYHEGHPSSRRAEPSEKAKRFTQPGGGSVSKICPLRAGPDSAQR